MLERVQYTTQRAVLTRLPSLLYLFCAIPAFSQAPVAAPVATNKSPEAEVSAHDAPVTFSSRTNLVMVPVVVRDQKGNAIGTFKKEDFQLFDKGKPQVISRFTIEKADGKVVPLEITATDPDAAKTPEGPPPASRFVAYLFDDMHVNFADLARARIAAVKYIAESMKPVDRAAIFTTSGQNVLDFTDDRAKLEATINRIQPRSRQDHASIECPPLSDYVADLIENRNDTAALGMAVQAGVSVGCIDPQSPANLKQQFVQSAAIRVLNFAEADLQVSLAMLKAAVQRMGVMPGQRSIVLVSGGFLVTDTYRPEEMEVLDRAIHTNVVINTLDARGLYTVIAGGDASSSGSTTQCDCVIHEDEV